ncbi:MAG: 2-amino-4-hydroxy-6-hydroxymethyldihydropteridine diphosphokinase, partial [Nitrospirales bacterium]|nr:2-amino-4-hydroxy-6-hydroxymethyldihydropteridine diphosphokinase [Nitrospirales bacterium]
MAQEIVLIGFGSNVGDRQELCDRAVALMNLLPRSCVTGVSSYYESEPIDPQGILGPTWFYNGVVRLETSLSSQRLLGILQETERALGRDEDNRCGPRTMDFDIVFFGQHVIEQPGLTIPHPRLHQRRFVLEPLVELDPGWNHPVFHRSVKELLESLSDTSLVNKLDV